MSIPKHRDRPKWHCMVVHAYYPLGETRVEREAFALIDHGYNVDVICLQDRGESRIENVNGVTIYRMPIGRSKRRGLFLQLLEYLAFFLLVSMSLIVLYWRRRYGVIQVHNPPDFLVFTTLIPKLLGARVILDLHDLMPEFFAVRTNLAMDLAPIRLMIWQEQLSCRFADHVITVTEIWRQTLINRGVPAHKLSVVMNIADPRVFHGDSVARSSEKADERFELIYHGTLTHRYGVDIIIEALSRVRSQIPGIHLTLIGGGDAREELQQLTEALELRDHVEISKQLVHASQLPQIIRQADVGVVPNRNDIFTDTLLPTKLLEYVAMTTPVIAARTQTIAAYFDDTMIKFFCPGSVDGLAACILDLYENRSQLESLASSAATFSKKYNWKSIASEYVATVDRLTAA